jgi:hypothetical protein
MDGSGRDLFWDALPSFAWREWQKPRKTLSHNSRCPHWDSNRLPPAYKSEALPLQTAYSVRDLWIQLVVFTRSFSAARLRKSFESLWDWTRPTAVWLSYRVLYRLHSLFRVHQRVTVSLLCARPGNKPETVASYCTIWWRNPIGPLGGFMTLRMDSPLKIFHH